MISTFLQVAAGGALGAMARFGLGHWIYKITGPGFPLAIISVNILGSFLMGAFVVFAAQRGWTHFAPFVQIGVLGGFTTFSSFSLEAMTLMERGQVGEAAAYVLLSVGASIGALYVGVVLARLAFA